MSRGSSPRYSAKIPSSRGIFTSASKSPAYLAGPSDFCCAINRVCTRMQGTAQNARLTASNALHAMVLKHMDMTAAGCRKLILCLDYKSKHQ